MIKLNDIVAVSQDLPREGLRAGTKGVVVEIFDTPTIAYEVEFCDEKGRTLKTAALLPSQITKV
jgi:hypothetical protein